MAEEYKNYDATDEYKYTGAKLTEDAVARDTTAGKMVRLKVVSTSRNKGKNGIDDLWVEVNVADFYVEAASFMKKGDVLHEIRGKPYLRRYGDNNQMVSFCLERAQLHIPSDLKVKLKERGWSGGGASTSVSGSPKGAPASRKPISSKAKPAARSIEELPED